MQANNCWSIGGESVTASVVAALGKSRSYVYARLKLCALLPAAREAFYHQVQALIDAGK